MEWLRRPGVTESVIPGLGIDVPSCKCNVATRCRGQLYIYWI